MWSPVIGHPLHRAREAWEEPSKWEWILTRRGHGEEWWRVFRVRFGDAQLIWSTMLNALPAAPVISLRDDGHGLSCGVLVELTLNERRSLALTAWHYAHAGAAPRLVTAYPATYNRNAWP